MSSKSSKFRPNLDPVGEDQESRIRLEKIADEKKKEQEELQLFFDSLVDPSHAGSIDDCYKGDAIIHAVLDGLFQKMNIFQQGSSVQDTLGSLGAKGYDAVAAANALDFVTVLRNDMKDKKLYNAAEVKIVKNSRGDRGSK